VIVAGYVALVVALTFLATVDWIRPHHTDTPET
jgi:hypothetical protein